MVVFSHPHFFHSSAKVTAARLRAVVPLLFVYCDIILPVCHHSRQYPASDPHIFRSHYHERKRYYRKQRSHSYHLTCVRVVSIIQLREHDECDRRYDEPPYINGDIILASPPATLYESFSFLMLVSVTSLHLDRVS